MIFQFFLGGASAGPGGSGPTFFTVDLELIHDVTDTPDFAYVDLEYL